jgi:hypothetical protein
VFPVENTVDFANFQEDAMTDERDPKVQLLVEKRVSEAREEAAQNVSEARENMASRILDAREDATKKAHRARNEAIGVLAFVALVLTIGGWFGLQYVAKGQLDDRALQSLLSEATTARDRILGYESQAREDLGTIERLQSLQESVKSRLANLKLAKTYE